MSLIERRDEMVDGNGGFRPHWRHILAAFTALGERGTAERIGRLNQAFEEEGVSSLLPGSVQERAWRCDPVPLIVSGSEFAHLARAMAQRARLLEAVLQDIYGPQRLLADGELPPAIVHANPAFLRACQVVPEAHMPPRFPLLHQYAVDLMRGPDGAWRVLADRCAAASGIGYARENRRILGRVLPELFRSVQVRPLRPFFDLWQDALQRLAMAGADNPAIAILTPGAAHRGWFEHMYLSRELGAVLVEGGDLTVRNGVLYLKTLRGLQRVHVLVRKVDGRLIDPLELEVQGGTGIVGLMDAIRAGNVRVLNDPGSGMVEAPALAAFLPRLCLRLLGEQLELQSIPTLWLGQQRAREMVVADPAKWLIRSATDGTAPAILLGELSAQERQDLLAGVEARPWDYAASAWMPPSVAPCATEQGLVPKPIVLRMFLVFDGQGWHPMPGGLAHVVEESGRLAGRLPTEGHSKDVWVMTDEGSDIVGPAALAVPRLSITRTAAEIPSRVADMMFWMGRYMERLEASARLIRCTLRRVVRTSPSPRDVAELRALAFCLQNAGIVGKELGRGAVAVPLLSSLLLRTVRDGGLIASQLIRVGHLTETVRDRLTDEMYATFTSMLREAQGSCGAVEGSLDRLGHAMAGVLRFSASVAGAAAENMVRGGGWLFLDLGRRIERSQSVCAAVAYALEQPVARIEGGLRLALELCDSAITYRSRYLTVLQPAPVLDLVLADPSNPRALSFQLSAIRTRLAEIIAPDDALLAEAALLAAEPQRLVDALRQATDDAEAATALPRELRRIGSGVADLSDRINRRFFALLATAHAVTMEEESPDADTESPRLRGAA